VDLGRPLQRPDELQTAKTQHAEDSDGLHPASPLVTQD
jgi:hypothetical protein